MDTTLDVLAHTVLYDGYVLYPSRLTAPPASSRTTDPLAPADFAADSKFQAECLLVGTPGSRLSVRARFLHPLLKRTGNLPPVHEAIERQIEIEETPLAELNEELHVAFGIPPALELDGDTERFQYAIEGVLAVRAERAGSRAFRISARIENLTPSDRDGAAMRSMGSAHLVLRVHGGEFVSLLNPPEDLRAAAAGCQNSDGWPVLAGEPNRRDTMLVSPIVLSDFPLISPGTGDYAEPAEHRSRSHSVSEWKKRTTGHRSFALAPG